MNSLAWSELVTIYVGANSHEHRIPRADLAKSPILTSWVKTDSDAPYIMHPDLRTVNSQHFGSLIRFMHTGEYLPRVVEIPTGMNGRGTVLQRKGLDKLRTSEEYSAQLVRAGQLYKLAEQFQVQGLTDYIFNRVSEAELITYTNEALLTFAINFFSRPAATICGSSETNQLEVWILEKIAWEFQVIMKNHAAQFFKIPSKTGKSNFFPRLLRRKAEQVEEIGGEPDHLD